jgi:hypothetical protein
MPLGLPLQQQYHQPFDQSLVPSSSSQHQPHLPIITNSQLHEKGRPERSVQVEDLISCIGSIPNFPKYFTINYLSETLQQSECPSSLGSCKYSNSSNPDTLKFVKKTAQDSARSIVNEAVRGCRMSKLPRKEVSIKDREACGNDASLVYYTLSVESQPRLGLPAQENNRVRQRRIQKKPRSSAEERALKRTEDRLARENGQVQDLISCIGSIPNFPTYFTVRYLSDTLQQRPDRPASLIGIGSNNLPRSIVTNAIRIGRMERVSCTALSIKDRKACGDDDKSRDFYRVVEEPSQALPELLS